MGAAFSSATTIGYFLSLSLNLQVSIFLNPKISAVATSFSPFLQVYTRSKGSSGYLTPTWTNWMQVCLFFSKWMVIWNPIKAFDFGIGEWLERVWLRSIEVRFICYNFFSTFSFNVDVFYIIMFHSYRFSWFCIPIALINTFGSMEFQDFGFAIFTVLLMMYRSVCEFPESIVKYASYLKELDWERCMLKDCIQRYQNLILKECTKH